MYWLSIQLARVASQFLRTLIWLVYPPDGLTDDHLLKFLAWGELPNPGLIPPGS